MIYGFDDNKNKIEILNVVTKTYSGGTAGDQTIIVNYPTNFNRDNTILLSAMIKFGNNDYYEEFRNLSDGKIKLKSNNIEFTYTGSDNYTIKVALARVEE